MASDEKDKEVNGESIILDRRDNKVSKSDHAKFKEAFEESNIDELDDSQLTKIYKFEPNLIKSATRNDNGKSIELIATKKIGLDEVDASLLATELIRLFGDSTAMANNEQIQGQTKNGRGAGGRGRRGGRGGRGGPEDDEYESKLDNDESDSDYIVNGHKISWKNTKVIKFTGRKQEKYKQNKKNNLKGQSKKNNKTEIADKELKKKSYDKEVNQAVGASALGVTGVVGAGVGVGLTEAGSVAVLAFGGAAAVFGVATAVAVKAAWDYSSANQKEQEKYKAKLKYNDQVAIYGRRVEKYNKIAQEWHEKNSQLKKYEAKLNQGELINYANRLKSLLNDESRIIMAIGLTQNGKSLVCNRLFGDKSSIEEISGDGNRLFKVGGYLQAESETSEMKMVTSDIEIIEKVKLDDLHFHNYKSNDIKFKLYVTDTVGACNSKGINADDLNETEMVEFCKLVGGVNAFLVFFGLGNVVDKNYKNLLKKYHKIWGDNFWEYCIIVITKCEKPDNISQKTFQDAVKKTLDRIKAALNEISNNKFGEKTKARSELYTFGANNFKGSVLKLFTNLYNDYNTKYQPLGNQTEMDKIWYELQPIQRKMDEAANSINQCKHEMERLRRIFEN